MTCDRDRAAFSELYVVCLAGTAADGETAAMFGMPLQIFSAHKKNGLSCVIFRVHARGKGT